MMKLNFFDFLVDKMIALHGSGYYDAFVPGRLGHNGFTQGRVAADQGRAGELAERF
jgi:hypothetical protein